MRTIKRQSEALLISAMVNTEVSPNEYGLSQEMLHSYPSEYQWVSSYPKTFGHFPTSTALLVKFPDFPYQEDAHDIAFAADEVINNHSRRMLVQAIQDAADNLEHGDVDEAIMAVTSFLPPVRSKPIENDLRSLDFLDEYGSREDVLQTPWDSLQSYTRGIRKGDLWYVAARLGQGKSWVLANFAATALLDGRNVRLYSLEMSKAQVLTRMHVLMGAKLGLDVDHVAMRDRIFDPDKYRIIANEISSKVPGQLSIVDSSEGSVSPTNLVQDKNWADLCLIDYAGLMRTPSGGRAIDDWRAMATISNTLKEVAVSHDIRVVVAAQINRDGDQGANSIPPRVKNLAQSDSLGQDADVVLTHKQMSQSVMVYGLEKNRHGEASKRFYTRFQPNIGKFNEIDKELALDIKDEEMDE